MTYADVSPQAMNPNYTEFKFPQIKAHPWARVFKSKATPGLLHTQFSHSLNTALIESLKRGSSSPRPPQVSFIHTVFIQPSYSLHTALTKP